MPRISLVPSARTPSAKYTAFLTAPSSRNLTRRASKKSSGYIGSSGRFCHSMTSSMTSPVMVEIRRPTSIGFPDLEAYARISYTRGRPQLDAAPELTHRIFDDFEFDGTATDILTPLEEVLRGRRGVCQDFAQLMIRCLRSIACRRVI
jgi:transglutaminase-like putative cysteine protease